MNVVGPAPGCSPPAIGHNDPHRSSTATAVTARHDRRQHRRQVRRVGRQIWFAAFDQRRVPTGS
jgi:hypothetical protein